MRLASLRALKYLDNQHQRLEKPRSDQTSQAKECHFTGGSFLDNVPETLRRNVQVQGHSSTVGIWSFLRGVGKRMVDCGLENLKVKER